MSAKEVECYQTIYNKLLNKINKNYSQQTQIIFSVPVIFVGNSAYNLKKCLVFIIKKMRDNGYNITYKHPNNLIVELDQLSCNSFENVLCNGNKNMYNNLLSNVIIANDNKLKRPQTVLCNAACNDNACGVSSSQSSQILPECSPIQSMMMINKHTHNNKKHKKHKKKYITDQSILNILAPFRKD